MLCFKQLPIEKEYEAAADEKEAAAVLESYRSALVHNKGVQIVLKVLRDTELDAMQTLRHTSDDKVIWKIIGQLGMIDNMRSLLELPSEPAEEAVVHEMEA